WEEVADAPHAVVDLAYGNGAYVIATENLIGPNLILRSSDGLNWSEITLPLDDFQHVRAITFAKGKFHIVASEGAYLTSEDGLSWDLFIYPETPSYPHLDFLNFVGGKLLTGGSFGELYELRAEVPPVIDMPYSQSFPVGEYLNVPIGVSGEVAHFAVEGLPEGLSVSGDRIQGIPNDGGVYRISIVAFSGNTFSEPVDYYMIIYDRNLQVSLNDDPHFVTPYFQLAQLVNFPDNNHGGWSMRSPDLPAGLTIQGFHISGSLDPGFYSFTLELLADDNAVIESKQIPVYVSEEIPNSLGYQFLQLHAIRGIPLTESFLFENQALVTGVSGVPPGLSFDLNSKQLTGIPAEAGTFVLEVSTQNGSSPWYVRLEIAENLIIAGNPSGFYNPEQQDYAFEVNALDPNGVSFQWFYGDEPLMDGAGVSGASTHKLLVNDLSLFDSSQFTVRLTKGDSIRVFEVPYLLGPDDYYAWAQSLGLEGGKSAPETDGLGTGYPNLFAFLQGIKNPREFQHPALTRSGPQVSIRFKTTKDWRQGQLAVLFASDLDDDALILRPKIVQEELDYYVWESLAFAGSDPSSFFYLSVEIAE
ncbi:MAG: hypothetical protein KJT03_02715, partial [Verrucomicrobiae bacterium]|nr:hypothetical protein [Verrucomicrobiae bacterium]